jgi:hypothetical protein
MAAVATVADTVSKVLSAVLEAERTSVKHCSLLYAVTWYITRNMRFHLSLLVGPACVKHMVMILLESFFLASLCALSTERRSMLLTTSP